MKTLYYKWLTHSTTVVSDVKHTDTQKSIELTDEEFDKIIAAKRIIDEFELLKLLEHEFQDPNGEPHFIYG